MSVISKVLTAALYRIGQTDLLVKMQGKIHEAVLQAQQIANQTVQEAQDIADTFTIRNVGSQENVDEIVTAFGTAVGFEDGSQHYEFAEYEEEATLAYLWTGEDNYTYRTAKRTPEVGDTIYENDGTDTGNTVTSVDFPTQLTVTQQWPGDPASSQPVDTNVQQISCADGESYNFVEEQSSPSVEGFPFQWKRHVKGMIYMAVYTANRNPSVGDTAKYNAAIDPTTVTVADRPSVGTQHTVYDNIMYIGGTEVTV